MLLFKKYLLKISSNKYQKKIGVDFSIFKNQSLNKKIFADEFIDMTCTNFVVKASKDCVPATIPFKDKWKPFI